jgi:hypothetical protein
MSLVVLCCHRFGNLALLRWLRKQYRRSTRGMSFDRAFGSEVTGNTSRRSLPLGA